MPQRVEGQVRMPPNEKHKQTMQMLVEKTHMFRELEFYPKVSSQNVIPTATTPRFELFRLTGLLFDLMPEIAFPTLRQRLDFNGASQRFKVGFFKSVKAGDIGNADLLLLPLN